MNLELLYTFKLFKLGNFFKNYMKVHYALSIKLSYVIMVMNIYILQN